MQKVGIKKSFSIAKNKKLDSKNQYNSSETTHDPNIPRFQGKIEEVQNEIKLFQGRKIQNQVKMKPKFGQQKDYYSIMLKLKDKIQKKASSQFQNVKNSTLIKKQNVKSIQRTQSSYQASISKNPQKKMNSTIKNQETLNNINQAQKAQDMIKKIKMAQKITIQKEIIKEKKMNMKNYSSGQQQIEQKSQVKKVQNSSSQQKIKSHDVKNKSKQDNLKKLDLKIKSQLKKTISQKKINSIQKTNQKTERQKSISSVQKPKLIKQKSQKKQISLKLLQKYAAIRIQSVWRGYNLRKLIKIFFQQFEQEKIEKQDSFCIFDDEISMIKSQGLSDKSKILIQNLKNKQKVNLQIDTSEIEKEHENNLQKVQQSENSLQNINNIRQFLGSEQLVRQSWENIDKNQINPVIDINIQDSIKNTEIQSNILSMTSPSVQHPLLFKCQPFQEFVQKKFKEMMVKENMEKLIETRENVLQLRHKTEVKNVRALFKKNQVTPNTFEQKYSEIEKWVEKEKNDIQKTKVIFEQNWLFANQTLQKTKRDIQFMHKILDKNKSNLTFLNTINSDDLSENSSSVKNRFKNKLQDKEQQIQQAKELNKEQQNEQLLKSQDNLQHINKQKYLIFQNKCQSIENDLIFEILINVQIEQQQKQQQKILELQIQQIKQQQQEKLYLQQQKEQQEQIDQQQKELIAAKLVEQEILKEIEKQKQDQIENQRILQQQQEQQKQEQLILQQQQELQQQEQIKLQQEQKLLQEQQKQYQQQIEIAQFEDIKIDDEELISVDAQEQNSIIDTLQNSQQKEEGQQQINLQINQFECQQDVQKKEKIKYNEQKDICNLNNIKQFDLIKKDIPKKISPNHSQINENQLINVSSSYVKQYINYIIEKIIQNKDQLLERLNEPMGLNDNQSLELMHKYIQSLYADDGQDVDFQNNSQIVIVENKIFDQVQKNLLINGPIFKNKMEFNLQAIFNRLIFDTFNEQLDNFRIVQNLNWKPTHICKKKLQSDQLKAILDQAQNSVFDFSNYQCGFLNEKFENINDANVIQIREEKMTQLLAQQLLDYENQWIKYDLEESEVAINISNLIFQDLIQENIDELEFLTLQRQDTYFL